MGSPDRFGYSWDIFSEILSVHHEQFRRWSAALPADAWKSVQFLDAGCGMGRNSHWAMVEGAAGGAAIDLDDRSLAEARGNLGPHPTVEVRKHSIYNIPVENKFDVAFSIGVIHHLADPEAAVRQLIKAAKPGGRVLIWCTARKTWAG